MAKKLRIAWFSTNKPETLSRYATERYLPLLRDTFEITQYVGDSERGGEPFGTAYETHRQNPFDNFIYCLERDSASNFAWASLGVNPGIVLMLEDFAPPEKPWLFQSGYEETATVIQDPEKHIFSLEDTVPYMVDAETRAATLARSILLASEDMLARIPATFHRKCSVLHLPILEPELPKKLGIFQIAVCSPVVEDYLVSKIFLALKNLQKPVRLTWLLDNEKEKETLLRKEIEFKTSSFVTLETRPRSFAGWNSLLSESNVALHLQGWGRSSVEPYLGMSLSNGLPVIITNFGAGRVLSKAVALKISIGLSCAGELETVLRELHENGAQWPTQQQKEYADSIYDCKQNAEELSHFIEASTEQAQRQNDILRHARGGCRQQWVDRVTKDLDTFAIGNNFIEGKTFLQELLHD